MRDRSCQGLPHHIWMVGRFETGRSARLFASRQGSYSKCAFSRLARYSGFLCLALGRATKMTEIALDKCCLNSRRTLRKACGLFSLLTGRSGFHVFSRFPCLQPRNRSGLRQLSNRSSFHLRSSIAWMLQESSDFAHRQCPFALAGHRYAAQHGGRVQDCHIGPPVSW